MYRPILIKEDQREFQRIFWKYEDSTEIEKNQLNTITYGMILAPYLAIRCLQQIARNVDCPTNIILHASNVILHDFYMDDFLFGPESVQETQELKQIVFKLLSDYELRNWASNQEDIVHSNTDESCQLPLSDIKDTKTLRLLWNPEKEKPLLDFVLNITISDKITKRMILSTIACIFDPFGLIVLIILTAN